MFVTVAFGSEFVGSIKSVFVYGPGTALVTGCTTATPFDDHVTAQWPIPVNIFLRVKELPSLQLVRLRLVTVEVGRGLIVRVTDVLEALINPVLRSRARTE